MIYIDQSKIPTDRPIKFLRGGIGDLLLRLDNINQKEFYILLSHFTQAADLIKPYTSNFEYVFMDVPIGSIANGEVEPVTYPTLKISGESLQKAKQNLSNKKIIGIHPIGSYLSRVCDASIDRPQKFMTDYFIKGVENSFNKEDFECILFCAPNEISQFKHLGIKIVSEPNIWDCFAYISCCDLVIAVDSAVKSVSAIQHIPTIVLLGDYEDPYRDIFIKPYKEIVPVRFINIDLALDQTITEIIRIINTWT